MTNQLEISTVLEAESVGNPLYLSKSKYCSGVQCPKMLWLKKNKPEAFDSSVLRESGGEASATFMKIASMDPNELDLWRDRLLKYCRLDTFAMVKVWEKLKEVIVY